LAKGIGDGWTGPGGGRKGRGAPARWVWSCFEREGLLRPRKEGRGATRINSTAKRTHGEESKGGAQKEWHEKCSQTTSSGEKKLPGGGRKTGPEKMLKVWDEEKGFRPDPADGPTGWVNRVIIASNWCDLGKRVGREKNPNHLTRDFVLEKRCRGWERNGPPPGRCESPVCEKKGRKRAKEKRANRATPALHGPTGGGAAGLSGLLLPNDRNERGVKVG